MKEEEVSASMPKAYGEYYQDGGRSGGVSAQGGQWQAGERRSSQSDQNQGGHHGAVSDQAGQGNLGDQGQCRQYQGYGTK
jgi:hypothetical protein